MKLLCLDSNSIINRAFYGVKILTTKDGTYTNAVVGFLNILLKLLADVQPDAVVCAFDLKAPTFRHKMFDGYKAQRKGMPRSLPSSCRWSNNCSKAWATPSSPARAMKRTTSSAPCLPCANKAATNALLPPATATAYSSSAKIPSFCWQVPAWVKTKRCCATRTIFPKIRHYPQRLVDIKALMGDSSDNIPGVAGIGEKTALKLVGQYGDIDHIYADLDALEVSKSIRAKLEQGKESAYLSRTPCHHRPQRSAGSFTG